MFPFRFSSINQAMISQNPRDSINLFWNEQMLKSQSNAMRFMTPVFDFSSTWMYPEFTQFGNNLLNPMLAVQQCMNNWQNNSGVQNLWSQTPWNQPFTMNIPSANNTTNTSNMSDADKAKYKKMDREYEALKTLINTYKNVAIANKSINPDLLDKIEVALSNNGAAPKDASEGEKKRPAIERKLDALRDIYNQLDKNALRKAVSSLETKDYNIKDILEKAGYKFSAKEYSYKNAKDADLNNKLSNIHTEIANIEKGKSTGLTKLEDMVETLASKADESNDILRNISYWNDKYKDKEERSIIRFLTTKMQSSNLDSDDRSNIYNKHITKLVNALKSRAEYLMANAEAFDEDTVQALSSQITNVEKALESMSGKLSDKTKAEALCKEFEKLYVMLRRMEAQKINVELQQKYSFLNDISSTDADFINDELIVKDTEADLKSEGLDDVDTTQIKLENYKPEPKTAQEEVDELVSDKTLSKATDRFTPVNEVANCYKDSEGNYYTVKDGKIMKLDDVEYVYSNGRCVTKDKKMHNIADIVGTEVKASDIKPAKVEEKVEEKPAKITQNKEEKTLEEQAKEYATTLNKLINHTSVEDGLKIKSTIEKKLNAENIYLVLKSYKNDFNNRLGLGGHGGLCDQIDNEGDFSFFASAFSSDEIKARAIAKIVDCVLTWAENNDLQGDYYTELKNLRDKPEEGIESAENLRKNVELVDKYIACIIAEYETELD